MILRDAATSDRGPVLEARDGPPALDGEVGRERGLEGRGAARRGGPDICGGSAFSILHKLKGPSGALSHLERERERETVSGEHFVAIVRMRRAIAGWAHKNLFHSRPFSL